MYRRILNFGLYATAALSVTAPLLLNNSYKCWGWKKEEPAQDLDKLRNRLKNRLSIVEYPSNSPNEDATQFAQLKSVDGYAVGVFDGHGGNEVSEYLKKNLLELVDQKIKANLPQEEIKGDKDQVMNKLVTDSILEAFNQVEKHILAQTENPEGIFRKKQGSCALIALVIDNFLYVANLGDSQAMIIGYEEGKIGVSTLTKSMNINNPYLFNKLKAIYDEKSNFVDIDGKKYIATPEGKIQLTGSIGDWFIKKNHVPKLAKQFLETSSMIKSKKQKDSEPKIPLVTSKPQISFTQLKETDAYLLLGSNGFWDEIKKEQIAEQFQAHQGVSEYAAEEMLEDIVYNIAESMEQTEEFVRDLPHDLRPQVFDDISIILVDLKNQLEEIIQ